MLWSGALMGADWRQFRGNDTSGVADDSQVPLQWSGTETTENIAWKRDLPGRGLSGPIVVGDRVVLTASSGYRQDRLHILCFDDKSGALLWERQFWATGRTMCHPKMCIATPTPASDGERIFAFYSTNDVVCLDLDGNLQWFRGLGHDYPNASNSLGMASSPIVVGDTLVLQCENDSDSFAVGLDVLDGSQRWKIVRPQMANWTSALVYPGSEPGKELVLFQSGKGMTAYEPRSGKPLWNFDKGAATIPSSAISGDTLYIPSNGLAAVRPASANANPEIVWQEKRLAPATSSPIAYRGQVFVLNSANVLACADASTGKVAWQLRLKGPFTSTPVAANGHLYFFNEEGQSEVVKPGPTSGEIVATNQLGEMFLCTPAIAHNALYIRSDKHLWKIAKN